MLFKVHNIEIALQIYTIKLITKTFSNFFAEKMQIEGIDIDKNAIQRIEAGKRFVTDIEILVFSKVLNISLNDLLNEL